MIKCTNCGATHPDDSNFCDQCGEDLVINCPACGATARPTAKFCPKCRNRLNGNASEEKIFKDNVIAGDVNASTSTTIVTNNYGPSFSDFDDAFCGECGEIIPNRLKIFSKCKDCGEYFCNKHLNNQICHSCKNERLLTPFIFEKRANNKYAILRLKNLHEISVDIPSFVESIEDGAFEGSHLIHVTFHDGLIKIGNRAFANCKDMGDVSFPSSLRIIGEEAFYGCLNLSTEISSTIRIGTNAFHGTINDSRQQYYDMGMKCYDQKNYDQAVYYFQQAADQGHVPAWCSLGVCYYYGRGVNKDETQAIYWYRKAAEQGRAVAQCQLGKFYASGEGVEKDDVQAVYWYKKAAEQDYAEAQHQLGLCYARGEGVQKDAVQAVYWYKKAAEQGHKYAQCALGVCYADGIGVNKDSTQALYWFKQSAEQGFVNAQTSLGTLYKNKGDIELAKYWYKKAADQGDWLANSYLKDLSSPTQKSVDSSASDGCEVWLTNIGCNALAVIKTVRQITCLGLKEAKDITNNCPSLVVKGVSMDRANEVKAMLENDGARVEIKGGK